MVTATEGSRRPQESSAHLSALEDDGRVHIPEHDDALADEHVIRVAHFLTQHQGELWPKRTSPDGSQGLSDGTKPGNREVDVEVVEQVGNEAEEGDKRHSKKRRFSSSGESSVVVDDLGVTNEKTVVTVADVWSALEFDADLEALRQFEMDAENLYEKMKDPDGGDCHEVSEGSPPKKKRRQGSPLENDNSTPEMADGRDKSGSSDDKAEEKETAGEEISFLPTRADFDEAIRGRRDDVKRREQLRRRRVGRSKSDREVLLLLKAMKLRSTSALSHTMLLMPQKWATAKHDDTKFYPTRSFSPFLNLPDAGHFHELLSPEISQKWGYDNSIAIPQNLPPSLPLPADPKTSSAESTTGVEPHRPSPETVPANVDARISPPLVPGASSPNDHADGRRKRSRPPVNPLTSFFSSPPPAFLSVVPNEYSSREFLRICAMLSLLPDDRARMAVATSPVAAVSSSIQQQSSRGEVEKLGEEEEVQMVLTEPLPPHGRSERRHFGTLSHHPGSELSEKAVLGQPDLVALWIRSQRSTSAFRHITNLFTIERKAIVEPSLFDEANSGVDANEGLRFIARYVGNGRKTRTKVEKECLAMDELVQWSVLNQVLFTYHHVREILSRPEKQWYENERRKLRQQKVRNKKVQEDGQTADPGNKPGAGKISDEVWREQRNSAEADTTKPSSDRCDLREGGVVDEHANEPNKEAPPLLVLDSLDAIHAQQAYLLRWFARRHRKALTVLFLTEPMCDPEAVTGGSRAAWLEDFVKLKVTAATKSKMRKSLNAGNDRTFARLDRRVLLGKYLTDETGDCFRTIVAGLVDAFTTSLPQPYTAHADIKRLRDDFETMYKLVLPSVSDGSVSKIQLKPLFEMHADDDENVICSLLHSLPKPWRDQCSICNDEVRKGNKDVMLECSLCGKNLHQLCERDRDPEPFDSAKELFYQDIDQYPPLQKAYSARAPDSASLPDFRETSSVKWSSHRIHMRRNKKRGWGLEVAITELCQDSLSSILEGSQLHTLDNLVCNYPMFLPYRGILIEGVKDDSPVLGSGLQRGDVIVAISFVADPSSKEQTILSEVEGPKRAALLKKEEKEAYVDVRRPSVDIVERSSEWLKATKRASEAVFAVLPDQLPTRWYCRDCRAKRNLAENNKNQIVEEARRCRAVVRRLGMEWCSLPFHKENACSTTDEFKSFAHKDISLERLDRMMGAIMARKHRQKLSHLDPFLASRLKGKAERLEWAPPSLETKPMELLCRGVSLLFTSPSECETPDPFSEQRRELATRFLKLFTSWCLDCGSKSALLGPPQSALRAVAPWEVWGNNQEDTEHNVDEVATDDNAVDGPMQSEEGSDPRPEPYPESSPATGHREETVANDRGVDLPDDDAVRMYNLRSSLVGTTILLAPNDPIIEKVSRKTKVTIEHMGRPVEFVIVSYIPFEFISAEVPDAAYSIVGETRRPRDDGAHNRDGIYHAIPIMTAFQLNYVLQLCKMRGVGKPIPGPGDDWSSWVSLEALNLPGVVRFSVAELGKRIQETDAMLSSAEKVVISVATCQNDKEVAEVLKGREDAEAHHRTIVADWLLGSSGTLSHEIIPSPETQTSQISNGLKDFRRVFKDRGFVAKDTLSWTKAGCLADLVAATECLTRACSMTEERSPLLEEFFDHENIVRRQRLDPLFCVDPTRKAELVYPGQGSTVRAKRRRKNWQSRTSRNEAAVAGTRDTTGDADPPMNVAPLPLPRSIQRSCTLSYSDLFVMDLLSSQRLGVKSLSELENLTGLKLVLDLRHPKPFRRSDTEDVSKHCFVLSRMVAQRERDTKSGRGGGDSDEDWTPGSDVEDDEEGEERPQDHRGRQNDSQSADGSFRGRGWGLEFVRWSADPDVLRIGRVHPNSPASAVGAKAHDIVNTINGKTAGSLSAAEIAKLMLPECRECIPANSNDSVANSLRKIMKKPSMGPVVVEVLRQRNPFQIHSVSEEQPTVAAPAVVEIEEPPPSAQNETIDVDIDPIPVERPANVMPASRPHRSSVQPPSNETSTHNRHVGREHSPHTNHHRQAAVPAHDRHVHQRQNNVTAQVHTHATNNSDAGHTSQRFGQSSRHVSARREIGFEDLYSPGVPGTVFTLVESSVLFEARARKVPLLGTRLLLPRYSISIIKEQYKVVIFHGVRDPSSIPTISRFWSEILVADYRRSVEETGPISFKEGGFSYRTPTARLPLDRILENFLRKESSKSNSQTAARGNEINRHHVPHSNTDNSTSRSPMHWNTSGPSNLNFAQQNPHHGHDVSMDIRNSRGPSSYHHGGFSNAPAPSYHKSYHNGGGIMASRTRPHVSQMAPHSNPYEFASSSPAHAAPYGTPTHHGSQVHHPPGNVGYPSGFHPAPSGHSGRNQLSPEGTSHPHHYHEDTHRRSTQNPSESNASTSVYDPLLELPVIDLVGDEFSSDKSGGHARTEANERNSAQDTAVQALNFGPYDGDPTQDFEPPRIRGGGGDDVVQSSAGNSLSLESGPSLTEPAATSSSRKRLGMLPSSDWMNESVCGTCLSYSRGKGFERASFLGFVVDIPISNDSKEATAAVTIVQVSSRGILKSPIRRHLDPFLLYVLKEDDGRREIIRCARKLLAQVDEHAENQSADSSAVECWIEDGPSGSNTVSDRSSRRREGSEGGVTEFDAIVHLFRDLCHGVDGYALLGYLPDGRGVFWSKCDPAALYIDHNISIDREGMGKKVDFYQQVYYRHIRRHKSVGRTLPQEPGLNFCVWGCKVSTQKEGKSGCPFLLFETREEFENHVVCRHNFGSMEASSSTMRVSQGERIRQLSVDLCASLCAQWGELAEFTVRLPEATSTHDGSRADAFVLDMRKVLDLTKGEADAGQPLDGVKDAYLGKLLLLWMRIALLFRVEDCGQFRFTEVESGQLWAPGLKSQLQNESDPPSCLLDMTPNVAQSSEVEEEESQLLQLISEQLRARQKRPHDGVALSSDTLFNPICERSKSDSSGKRCRLCSAARGKCQTVGHRPGLGCALMTEAFLSSTCTDVLIPVLRSAIDRLHQLGGNIAALQVSLLRVAVKVPIALRREGTTSQCKVSRDPGSKDSQPVYSMWDKDSIEKWCDYVCSSTNVAMVSQAYVVLSHSINKLRMPSWWKASRSGWSDVTTCLVRPSVSSVSMRIHILDAALAEVALASDLSGSRDKPDSQPHPSTQAMDVDGAPTAVDNTPTKEKFMKDLYDLMPEERIGKVVKWATEDLNTPKRTDDTNKEVCDVCGDGGDLMCCEFCDALQHVACCKPPVVENGALPEFDWVCNECVRKLANRYYEDVVSKAQTQQVATVGP